MRFNECVEHVDHRDIGANHVARHDTLGGIDRRCTDVDHVVGQLWSVVARLRTTRESTPQQVVGEGDSHRTSEKTHFRVRGNTAGTRKNLKRHGVVVELNHLCQRGSRTRRDLGKFVVLYPFCPERDHATGKVVDGVINLIHAGMPPQFSSGSLRGGAGIPPNPWPSGSSRCNPGSLPGRTFEPRFSV